MAAQGGDQALIGFRLRKRIFYRLLALLIPLIVAVSFSAAMTDIAHQNEYSRDIYAGQARILAIQATDLLLWDDRVGVQALLTRMVDSDTAVGYAYVEKNLRPFAHTFSRGFPKALLEHVHAPGEIGDVVISYEDQEGQSWYDIATPVEGSKAHVHIVVSSRVLFHRALEKIRGIAVFSLLAISVGVLMAWGIALLTTREVYKTTEALRESEERFRSVTQSANDAIISTDTQGNIISWNPRAKDIFGYRKEEIIGRPIWMLITERLRDQRGHGISWILEGITPHLTGQIIESVGLRKSDEEFPMDISLGTWVVDGSRFFSAVIRDITGKKEEEEYIFRLAHYDALTSLPNRLLLADRLHQTIIQTERSGQRLMVAYLDLDGFKLINDAHGHAVGDKLLVTVATRMKETLREVDTIARLGGDEFVAVLSGFADTEDSLRMISHLLTAVAQPVHVDDLVLQVSASIGATFYPQKEEVDADQLLRQADHAMYQAKLTGKNRYQIFDAELDRNIRGRHDSLKHIRRALSKGEFVLHYQPKVNMRTGESVGVEALIRWQHPEQGLLPPAVFLPLIEDHPLAIELGEWVLDTALTQLEVWYTVGLDISVSVNIGALQLQQAEFKGRLGELLAAHPNAKPSLLELEVLETSALEDVERMSQMMHMCIDEFGINFALDDFGTGYSSLTYLKLLPATRLKIDRSFVIDMLDDPEDLAIVEGVLGLAMAFRRQPIAEGVETMEHGKLLLQLGCELAQGYGIARPMPADELHGWIKSWRPEPVWTTQRPVSRDDLPLIFASVEHRAWIRAIEECIKGERTAPPPLDCHQCRFGHWLDNEGQVRHGTQPAFQDIKILHRQVHALAAELLELQAQDRSPEARMGELHDLRDTLLGYLVVLLQENQR